MIKKEQIHTLSGCFSYSILSFEDAAKWNTDQRHIWGANPEHVHACKHTHTTFTILSLWGSYTDLIINAFNYC